MSEKADQIRKRIRRIINQVDKNDTELEKLKVIIIDRKAIDEKRAEIIETLMDDTNSIFYENMVKIISNPAGIIRGRFISDGAKIQAIEDVVILLNRMLMLGGLVFIVLFFVNLWFILAGLLCWLLSYFILNRIQTILNIELAARLFVYDQLAYSNQESFIMEIQD
jgi:hypothetical protein